MQVSSSNFSGGQPLDGLISSTGNGVDDGTDDDGDENGIDSAGDEVTSIVISLGTGAEVTPETGKEGTSDNADETDFDLSLDLGFTPRNGVGIGNLVFCDNDGDGIFETGDGDTGAGGVIVELYDAADTPGVDPALRSTVTEPNGSYYFGNLPDGNYIVHIPASAFGAGQALEAKVSSAGSEGDNQSDDDAGENGVDSGDPSISGVSSTPITLESGSEPTEGGFTFFDDNAAESDNDLTIDMAFTTAPGTVGIGNLVFEDVNNDGDYDAGTDSGVDGVTVDLYLASAGPGVGSAIASTETSNGGCYVFTGLAPESYVVHIPASEFGVSGDLQNLASVSGAGGDTTTDDDGDENGVDPATDEVTDGVATNVFALATVGMPTDGDTETGKDAASDNVGDAAINLTADFGFAGKPGTYGAFQNEYATELGGDDAPDGNPDGDIYNNALEYALCDHPGSGTNANPFCVALASGSGTVDAQFTRLAGGLSDVTYTLEVAPGIGSPPLWTPTVSVPVVVDNGDGTETVTYPDLELQNAQGIARLKVELAGDLTGPHYTPTFGWHSQTNTAACETCSFPYAEKSAFSGTSSSAGPALSVSGTPVIDTAPAAYYIEILSGSLAGHRFDVASVAANTVNLDGASARNTLSVLPDLTGAPFALRQHPTLDSIAPPELFAADNDSTVGDRILAYSGGAWTTYWVFDLSGTQAKQWTDASDGDANDAGGTVVDACEGFFLHPKSGGVTLTMVGIVREWSFACPLDAGFSLVGSGYPLDQSTEGRAMTKIDAVPGGDWFSASNDPLSADQVMFWLGDANIAAEGYDTYFRLDLGIPAYDHWTYQGDSNLSDNGDDALFKLGRGAFYDMTVGHDKSDAAKVWLWPSPWDPDGVEIE